MSTRLFPMTILWFVLVCCQHAWIIVQLTSTLSSPWANFCSYTGIFPRCVCLGRDKTYQIYHTEQRLIDLFIIGQEVWVVTTYKIFSPFCFIYHFKVCSNIFLIWHWHSKILFAMVKTFRNRRCKNRMSFIIRLIV